MQINTGDLLVEAQRLGAQGRWQDAERRARQITSLEPENVDATLLLGICLSKQGNGVEAIRSFEEAVLLDGDNFVALNLAGTQCRTNGELDKAIEYSQKALALRPDQLEPALNLGCCFDQLGRVEEANRWADCALRARPEHPAQMIATANLLSDLGRMKEAESVLERAMAMAPSENGFVRLLEIQINNGKPASALRTGELAIRLTPTSGRIHLRMARALMELGREAEAERQFSRALELGKHLPEVHLDRGFWLQSRGRFSEAERSFLEAIRLDPKQGIAYFGIVHSRKVGKDDLAHIEAMQQLASDPETSPNDLAHLLYAIGKAYDNLNEPGRAIEFFDHANAVYRCLTLRGRDFDPVRNRAEVSRRIRDFTPALFERMRPFATQSDRPIMVLGMMRSGTTLVEQLLSRHSQVRGAGELHYWAGLDATGTVADLQAIAKMGRDYVELIRQKASDRARVADKNPANVMAAGLIHAAMPNARIIHMIRDPADTALSMWTTHVTQPPDFCCDRNNIVAMMTEYWRLAAHWRTLLPEDRYLEVSYEDLVSDPEPSIRRIVSFLGLEWSDDCLHPESNTGAVQTPSGWQVRQPLYRSSIGRWKLYEPWIPEFVRMREDLLKQGA